MLLDHSMSTVWRYSGQLEDPVRELLEAKGNTDSPSLSPEINQLVIRDKCLYEGIPNSGFILWFLLYAQIIRPNQPWRINQPDKKASQKPLSFPYYKAVPAICHGQSPRLDKLNGAWQGRQEPCSRNQSAGVSTCGWFIRPILDRGRWMLIGLWLCGEAPWGIFCVFVRILWMYHGCRMLCLRLLLIRNGCFLLVSNVF